MKDLSFLLLKNSIGVKMRKGIRNFCHGDGSTSTLNQHKASPDDDDNHDDYPTAFVPPSVVSSPYVQDSGANAPTLEQMILQLELEEEMARKAKMSQKFDGMRGRMSCVNNSDILRSARNALNQYPRFSLDGKDAMYRSSFRNSDVVDKAAGRRSVCCDRGLRERMNRTGFDSNFERRRNSCFRRNSTGESVVWCKPGVVAKLMGLDAMPVPVNSRGGSKETLSCIIKRQNLRKRAERREMEGRVSADNSSYGIKKERMAASCSKSGYCVMKPIAADPTGIQGGWPNRRFR